MVSKNPELSLQRCESHLRSRERWGNKPQAAQAIDEDEEDALFEAGEFGDSNPVALHWELCGGFYPYTSVSGKRQYQSSDPLLSPTAPVFTGAYKGSISGST